MTATIFYNAKPKLPSVDTIGKLSYVEEARTPTVHKI